MQRKLLLSGEAKLGVWGLGYVGFSTMANFAVNGVTCVGTDVSRDTVEAVNAGQVPVRNLDEWLGFPVKPLVDSGMMKATLNWSDLIDNGVAVHMVAVPTEKGDEPWDGALIDVTEKIAENDPPASDIQRPLIIIESTLTPNRTDEVVIPRFERAGLKVGRDILLGVAPRRDWFVNRGMSLKSLPRIVGGTSPEATEAMIDVLSIVCDHLVPAPDHRHAELVKSVENAYRHMDITLANQLSLAFPNVNMTEVLRLVGTKWNLETYHPSFGTGGYCIPVSSKYLLQGAERSGELTLLKAAIETDCSMPFRVADCLIKHGAKNVGILGLAYKGDLKVHTLSPTLKIVKHLRANKIHVKVHDPYYSADEIKRIVGVGTFAFPDGLREFDAVVIVARHRAYRSLPDAAIIRNLGDCKLVLDNLEETWSRIDWSVLDIEYHVAGDKNWL